MTRLRGRIKRTNFKPTNVHLPEKLKAELKKRFDADSDQVMWLAFALNALGDIDLKKSKDIEIDEALSKYLDEN